MKGFSICTKYIQRKSFSFKNIPHQYQYLHQISTPYKCRGSKGYTTHLHINVWTCSMYQIDVGEAKAYMEGERSKGYEYSDSLDWQMGGKWSPGSQHYDCLDVCRLWIQLHDIRTRCEEWMIVCRHRVLKSIKFVAKRLCVDRTECELRSCKSVAEGCWDAFSC